MLSEIRQSHTHPKLHDSIHMMQSSRTHRSREQNGGCKQLGGGWNEELLFNGYKVSVLQDGKSYENDWS